MSATRSNLAHWTGEAGDAAGARDQYAALLPLQERALGPDHPDTLTTRLLGDALNQRDHHRLQIGHACSFVEHGEDRDSKLPADPLDPQDRSNSTST